MYVLFFCFSLSPSLCVSLPLTLSTRTHLNSNPPPTHTQSASAVFSHLRDIISRWFKHLFKGMSAWINAELKKPMWVEIAHEFDKIINFCGINLGYKIPFQPIDSLNPSLPTLGIVCQPLSDLYVYHVCVCPLSNSILITTTTITALTLLEELFF